MDPTENVVSFIHDYDQTYGSQHPTFYVGTYNQALNEAKKDLKFVIVYLHGSQHQDTGKFCRETLSNPEVIQFINDNCLFWACSVDTPEGYRVSQSLRESTYPFIGVIVQREYRMTVVGRYLFNLKQTLKKKKRCFFAVVGFFFESKTLSLYFFFTKFPYLQIFEIRNRIYVGLKDWFVAKC